MPPNVSTMSYKLCTVTIHERQKKSMKQVFNHILETIGNTPMIRLGYVSGTHQFFAKMESFNPGMSIKDRLAIAIIEDAEKKGLLKPGGTIVEATSGNTGMG